MRFYWLIFRISTAWLCGWAAGALGAPASQELDKFLAKVHTLSAAFVQQSVDEQGQVVKNQGRFYLKRPRRFRWTYETPYRQEIVADGDKVWFYDPDLAQVTVKTIDAALGAAPALLLSGELNLNQRFVVAEQGKQGLKSWVKLRPKSEEDVFQSITVELTGGVLSAMELKDNFGQFTRIRFDQVELNRPLQDRLFRFEPPPGVDVFEG